MARYVQGLGEVEGGRTGEGKLAGEKRWEEPELGSCNINLILKINCKKAPQCCACRINSSRSWLPLPKKKILATGLHMIKGGGTGIMGW